MPVGMPSTLPEIDAVAKSAHNISRRSILVYLSGAVVMGIPPASGSPTNATVTPDPALKARIKAISNVFEVGGPEPDYAYIEDLNDGRGYTVTQYGFCTYVDEVATVIQAIEVLAPNTPLKAFLELLPPSGDGTDTVALRDFPAAWRKEAHSSGHLPTACDAVADHLFFDPAMRAAATAQIRSPIGQAVIYDTWLQHGSGSDADSFHAIHAHVMAKTGGIDNVGEAEFLRALLDVRKAVLNAPFARNTEQAWRESVPRVDSLLALLADNPNLIPPVRIVSAADNIFVL
jgi:chitosanase